LYACVTTSVLQGLLIHFVCEYLLSPSHFQPILDDLIELINLLARDWCIPTVVLVLFHIVFIHIV
jgi:hypothetical protein